MLCRKLNFTCHLLVQNHIIKSHHHRVISNRVINLYAAPHPKNNNIPHSTKRRIKRKKERKIQKTRKEKRKTRACQKVSGISAKILEHFSSSYEEHYPISQRSLALTLQINRVSPF